MEQDLVLKVIRLCRQMDETSRDVYLLFHERFKEEPLRSFWLQMSREESEHVDFWRRAEQIEERSGLSNFLDDTEMVVKELEHAAMRTKELLGQIANEYTVAEAFLLAYRMEFYLLHPAFNILFQVFGPAAGGSNPADSYEAHISVFISMLISSGSVTAELELLGETLQRLWNENRKLALTASYDYLTGLLNRRGFFAIATQVASLSQRNDSSIGVLMLDIDHFKRINDSHGHKGGDRVLKQIAKVISNSLRTSDLVCRYGGEEFVVFLPSTSPSMTAEVAERIRLSIGNAVIDGISLTISIGTAEGMIGAAPLENLKGFIRQADAALFAAKNSGRNRVVEYHKMPIRAAEDILQQHQHAGFYWSAS